jgi:hypothetical protein
VGTLRQQPGQDVRVTSWPEDGDPVFQNGTYNDPFVIVLMLEGKLQPVGN